MTRTGHPQEHDQRVAKASPHDLPDERSASLARLDVLVGRWRVEATFEAGFLGPGTPETTVRGQTSFQWLEGRYFLTQHSVNEPPIPSALSIIGIQRSSAEQADSTGAEPGTFVQHYYDSRGVTRDYQLTLEDRTLKIWREAPGFWQRYTGTISADGMTITGAWEASADGQAWTHDFNVSFTKTT